MKKKLLCIIIIGVILFVIFYQYNKKENIIVEPEYVFTYAENQPENYPTTLGGYKFAQLVEERTNGRIKIIIQAEGYLGDEKAVVKQLQFGGIDFARVSLSTLSETIPKLNVLQMPYLYRDSRHMWEVLEGEIGNDFLSSFDETQLVALSWYDAGARSFYTKQPVYTLEDMNGLRIRVQESDLMIDMVEALGAVAVPIVYEGVYSAFERDLIDGAENNWPSYEIKSHYEVAKYFTVDEHTRVPEVQICGKSTWDKLSKEDQEIIRVCAKESALYERKLWGERERQSQEIVMKNGGEVITLSDKEKEKFRNAVKGVYEEYCGDYKDVIDKIIEQQE
ncbi:TRAP transporter substrate-binding protein [Candidatus Galacturonibacter soehngenii]|uniref:TRAP transporter substrate-binding protein n=1 Tax=Candidatus Galacturonatibacter soehngenii TaxID=2307010 RepID=A0A7V7QNN9_9FIRM|nr:TRAP transporter substrate-binding protein [Candidatus Galacturonibacter soehngenii]KAB1440614.1 TRAP transporter substrate-binding protein [Candidatus Galacturonibacter soehngenii]